MTHVRVVYDGFLVGAPRLYRDVLALDSPTLATVVDALATKLGTGFRSVVVDTATGEISSQVAVLVNGQRLPLHTPLQEDDEVAFLVPIAGG